MPQETTMRALIADDQSDVLVALQLLLKSEGIATELATSPTAVIEKVARSKNDGQDFDVLLMDMNYARDTTSGGEGLDLISQIRMLDHSLPMIAMTAWGSIELAVEAMQRGLNDFIQKPWNNTRLIEVLHKQLERGRRLRAIDNKKERELIEARAIQQQMIPGESLQIGDFDFAVHWQPAAEVGGDYCEIKKLSDHQVAICIGDVSGKGLPAALLMANLQALVRMQEESRASPYQLVSEVNRLISQNTAENKFITFFYGIVETRKKQLTYTNAGHNSPLLVQRTGSLQRLNEGGILMGVVPDYPYQQKTIDLQSGDQLLLYTDGISEALSEDQEEFGEDRLSSILAQSSELSAQEKIEAIYQAVTNFHQLSERDDRTLILMKIIC